MLQLNLVVPSLRQIAVGDFDSTELRVSFIGDATVWGEGKTAVIVSDNHYAASRKDSLTGFLLVGRRYRVSRHEE